VTVDDEDLRLALVDWVSFMALVMVGEVFAVVAVVAAELGPFASRISLDESNRLALVDLNGLLKLRTFCLMSACPSSHPMIVV